MFILPQKLATSFLSHYRRHHNSKLALGLSPNWVVKNLTISECPLRRASINALYFEELEVSVKRANILTISVCPLNAAK